MATKILSPFPYYGGKAQIAPLICDMLDYNSTDIYIEPFGGACRVLLNKPRHKIEVYNDSSAGLCAFMSVTSNRNTAEEFIHKLYKTEYSINEFYKALLVRNTVEDNYMDELKRQVGLFIGYLYNKYNTESLILLKKAIRFNKTKDILSIYYEVLTEGLLNADEKSILDSYKRQYDEYMTIYRRIVLREYKQQYKLKYQELKSIITKKVNRKISSYSNKVNLLDSSNTKGKQSLKSKIFILNQIKTNEVKPYKVDKETRRKIRKDCEEYSYNIGLLETANNHDDVSIDDMELAIATYIVYSQSRDGMGKSWSDSKYKSTDKYHAQISRLYEVAERLQGVHVSQVGALTYLLKCSYLNNKRAMIYCDPSYLKPGDERKNLGSTYKQSSTYEQHELFLKVIYKAKCKLLVSNYDTELYNKYLNKENGWNRIEFETKTSVGGKKDNKRTEVLWYNY